MAKLNDFPRTNIAAFIALSISSNVNSMPFSPQNDASQNGAALSDALENLPPLAYPAQISSWPIAIGWWVLLLLAIIFIGTSIYTLWSHRKKNQVRTRCLAQLSDAAHTFHETGDTHHFLQTASAIIRIFCNKQYGDAALITLSGDAWLIALDSVVATPLLHNETGALLTSIYQPQNMVDSKSIDTPVNDKNAVDILAIKNLENNIRLWLKKAPLSLTQKNSFKSRENHHSSIAVTKNQSKASCN